MEYIFKYLYFPFKLLKDISIKDNLFLEKSFSTFKKFLKKIHFFIYELPLFKTINV